MNTPQDRTSNAVTAPAAPTRTHLFSGVVAGLIAALAVLAAAVLHSWLATPEEAWLPMKNIAATWLGVGALIGGVWTIVLGVASHFVNSIVWETAFGLLMRRRRTAGVTLLAGFVWGMIVWLVMTWIALPLIDLTMAARVALEPVWWWLLHVIYGVVLGAALLAMDGVASARGRGGAERMHHPRWDGTGLTRRQQQVYVIAHQDVCVQLHPVTQHRLTQALQVPLTIRVIQETRQPVVTPLHHVLGSAGQIEAWRSCHAHYNRPPRLHTTTSASCVPASALSRTTRQKLSLAPFSGTFFLSGTFSGHLFPDSRNPAR